MADKIRITLFSRAFLQIWSRIITQADNAASAIANAEILISSKLYPIQAVAITPAGYRIISPNNVHIKMNTAFFIQITSHELYHIFVKKQMSTDRTYACANWQELAKNPISKTVIF